MEEVRWGIIGCGDVTEQKSGPALKKIKDSSLVAVMRRTAHLAEDYAVRHNVASWYDKAEDLINDPKVNAVYIATPPSTHKKHTMMAAEAGLPIYVEKPMALNFEEAQEMIESAKVNGVQLHVAYYRRAMPRFLKIKELLDAGAIGELRTLNIRLSQPVAKEELKPDSVPWRVIPDIAGGGKFLDLASHTLDLFDYYFGPVEKTAGFAMNQAGYYQAEDNVSAIFRFANGVQAAGNWTFAGYHEIDENEIIGNQGRIVFSSFNEKAIILENQKGKRKLTYLIQNMYKSPY